MKFLNSPWQRPFIVQERHGRTARYTSFWQLVRRLRGRSFNIELDPDTPMPTLDELQSIVAERPGDARAQTRLGAWLHTYHTADEALPHYLEAIALLSNDEYPEVKMFRLADRAFARRMAAKALDDLGRNEEASEHWQSCADDVVAALLDKKYLADNGLYQEAIAKLNERPAPNPYHTSEW